MSELGLFPDFQLLIKMDRFSFIMKCNDADLARAIPTLKGSITKV